MTAVELFRRGELNMDRINRSHIILIPKRQGAMDIEDFQLISPSNLLYPILAKLLTNWLRESICVLISPFYLAFIPGRQRPNNVVLTGDTIIAWICKGTISFLWKVDFAKA